MRMIDHIHTATFTLGPDWKPCVNLLLKSTTAKLEKIPGVLQVILSVDGPCTVHVDLGTNKTERVAGRINELKVEIAKVFYQLEQEVIQLRVQRTFDTLKNSKPKAKAKAPVKRKRKPKK